MGGAASRNRKAFEAKNNTSSSDGTNANAKKSDYVRKRGSMTAQLAAPREEPYGVLSDAQKTRTYDVIVIGGGPVGCAA